MTSPAAVHGAGGPCTIAVMRWWHISAIAVLEERLFPEDSPWTPAMLWGELAAGRRYRVALGPGDEVLGYSGLALGLDAGGLDAAEVMTIGVAPEAQGAGIGRLLLGDMLTAARGAAVLLDVRYDNAPAIALYESSGFERIGVRRRYYQPSGADAYTMLRRRRFDPGVTGDGSATGR